MRNTYLKVITSWKNWLDDTSPEIEAVILDADFCWTSSLLKVIALARNDLLTYYSENGSSEYL